MTNDEIARVRRVGLVPLLLGTLVFGAGALGLEWPGIPVYTQVPFLTAPRLQMIYGVVFLVVGYWMRFRFNKEG